MKRYIIMGVMALLLVAHPAGAESAFLRINQVTYDPFPAEAGRYADVKINIQNAGSSPAPDVGCELLPAFPFSLDPGEDAVRTIGQLGPLSTALLEYRVRIDADAVEGDNELDIRCDADGLDDGTYLTHTLHIDVEAKNPLFAIGGIKSVPENLKADEDTNELTVELQNIGNGDAELAVAELDLPAGFSPGTSYAGRDAIGLVPAGATAEAVFMVDIDENVAAGVHHATLTVTFTTGSNNRNEQRVQELDVELDVQPSPRFALTEIRAGQTTASDAFTGYLVQSGTVISPSTLAPGDQGELRLAVTNTGEEDADSVSIRLFEDARHLPVDFDEVFAFLGDLKPGESADAVFRFTIDGDALLKTYLMDTEVRYVDGATVETSDLTVPLDITQERTGNALLYAAAVIVMIAGGIVWKKKKR